MSVLWPDLSRRELVGEVMDDPGLNEAEHVRALRALARINRLSRTAETIAKHLRQRVGAGSSDRPIRVLDVACGDGELSLRLSGLARRRGMHWVVDGCDLSERAIDRASERAERRGDAAKFFQADALGALPLDAYDAVVNSLFCHHLDDAGVARFLRGLSNCRHVVISDLVRSRRAYLATLAGVRVLSRSWVVHTDGPLSVRAALTRDELLALAERAGLTGARVDRCWPMRQMLHWSVRS